MYRYVIGLFCVLFCIKIVNGQNSNCQCALGVYENAKIDDAIRFSDNELLETIINKKEFKNHKYCQYHALFSRTLLRVKDHEFSGFYADLNGLSRLANELKCGKSHELSRLQLLAEYYQERDSIENATAITFELLKLAETEEDAEFELKAIAILSTLYVRQGQEKEFKPYFYRAMELINAAENKPSKIMDLVWLALNYENEYALTENKVYLDSVNYYTSKAEKLARGYQLEGPLIFIFQLKEAHAYHSGNFNKSIAYHDSTYHYLKVNKVYHRIPVYFQTKALTLMEMNEKLSTEIHQDSAIYYSRIYSQPSYLANILKQSIEVYGNVGAVDKVMQSFTEYSQLKDSLTTDSRSKIINELEQKYQKEKSQKTILELSSQRRLLFLVAALIMMALGFTFFIFKQRELRQKQVILETEQRLNRARMNPHFFFNTLASLQSFVLTDNDSMSVAENLSKFSHIMRETLENTYREYNSIQQELDFLREYLDLQQIRFPGKFEYTLSNKISNPDHFLLPSMIVQPFVENSVEHGFADIGYTGKLQIIFANDEDTTTILIIDNGRGLDNQIQKAKTYISRASQIVKDRIYLLNLKLKSNAQFSIANNTSGEGVSVKIILPTIHEN